jgi:hypothetical protein
LDFSLGKSMQEKNENKRKDMAMQAVLTFSTSASLAKVIPYI